jgi:quinol monooxygenase YgiN
MKRIMVRYRVKPGQVEENERLVRAVYEELRDTAPAAMRYATFRLDDGHSFVHLHDSGEGSPAMTELAAFREFQAGIRERCEEPPAVTELSEIGSYNWPGEVS